MKKMRYIPFSKLALLSLFMFTLSFAAEQPTQVKATMPSTAAPTSLPKSKPEAKRSGQVNRRVFQAFDVPEYQVDEALALKMKEEMSILSKLSSSYKSADKKADVMFRLAELYWLYDRSEYFKKLETYDKQYDAHIKNKLKTPLPVEPKFTGDRSFQVYKDIIKVAPNYPRLDEVLFLSGFHSAEIDSPEAEKYFTALVKKYPNSRYRPDAYMELGDIYFTQRKFDQAITAFKQTMQSSEKLKNFALYKISWCYYNKTEVKNATKIMQTVVATSGGKQNEIELREEALKDLILFFSDQGEIDEAKTYFSSVGEPGYARKVMEKLAGIYFDQARYDKAIYALNQLIDIDPVAPDVPRHHSKLIECYEKSEQLDKAMAQMQNFGTTYRTGSRWHQSNSGNTDDLAYAFDRGEVYARFLAQKNHEMAQKTEKSDSKKSKAYNDAALGFYKKYVDDFSTHKNAYEIRYLYAELLFKNSLYPQAADQYEKVSRLNPKGKRHRSAIIGNIDALARVEEEYYKSVVTGLKDKKEGDKYARTPLSPSAEKLVMADAQFIKSYPNDERAPKVLFQQSQIFYNYNQFDKSQPGFFNILNKYPNDSGANAARHLILDTYNIQKDWDNLEKHAGLFLGNKAFATPENKVLMMELIQGATFQRARDLEDQKKYLEAAARYERILAQYPDSKFADKAMYNASLDYLKADESNKALAMSEKFLKQFPKSPLVPQVMLIMATHFDDRLDYENAAKQYEALAEYDKNAKGAADALYNAGLYRENLGHTKLALANYETYVTRYPKTKDAAETFFSQALIYEKARNWPQAIALFKEYPARFSANKDKVVESHYRRGVALSKLKNSQAQGAFQAAAYQSKKNKAGIPYGAKAQMELTKEFLAEFQGIKLRMPQAALNRALTKKTELLKVLKDKYLKVIDTGDAEMGVSALYHIGLIYQDFSASLFNAPVPAGLTEQERQLYQQELQNRAQPFEQQGIEAFEKAVIKAAELNVYSSDTLKAYENLTQYKPDVYPPQKGELMIKWVTIEPVVPYQKGAGALQKADETVKTRAAFEPPMQTPARNADAFRKLIERNTQAVTANARDFDAYMMLGRAYAQQGDYKKASSEFENASLIQASNPAVLWEMGKTAIFGRQKQGVQALTDMLAKDPQNWTLENAQAVALRKTGYPEVALRGIRKALSADKQNIYAINNLGLHYYEQKKYELAELTFQKGLKRNPDHPETRNNLGVTYIAMGLFGNAIKEFEKAAVTDPNLLAPLINLSNLYLQYGNTAKSTNMLKQILDRDPLNVPINNNLGVALMTTAEQPLALNALREVLTIDPTNLDALMNIGMLYQNKRDRESAIDAYEQYIKAAGKTLSPNHAVFNLLKQAKSIPVKKDPNAAPSQSKSDPVDAILQPQKTGEKK